MNGIVFVVDASDRKRFEECRRELDMLLRVEELQMIPIAILGNKIDLHQSASEDELRLELGLDAYRSIENDENFSEEIRPIKIFMCSLAKKIGYLDAIKWLSQYIE